MKINSWPFLFSNLHWKHYWASYWKPITHKNCFLRVGSIKMGTELWKQRAKDKPPALPVVSLQLIFYLLLTHFALFCRQQSLLHEQWAERLCTVLVTKTLRLAIRGSSVSDSFHSHEVVGTGVPRHPHIPKSTLLFFRRILRQTNNTFSGYCLKKKSISKCSL